MSVYTFFHSYWLLSLCGLLQWSDAFYSNLKAPSKSTSKQNHFLPRRCEINMKYTPHSIFQLRWVCSKYTNIFIAFYDHISCNLTVQRSRRKNVSMPSSMGWSEQRSLALRSLKRWRKNGGFSNFRCVRSVVHLTWFENLSSSPEIWHSLYCFYFLYCLFCLSILIN